MSTVFYIMKLHHRKLHLLFLKLPSTMRNHC